MECKTLKNSDKNHKVKNMIELGATPYGENPVQVDGTPERLLTSRAQCRVFLDQLKRLYKQHYAKDEFPENFSLNVKSFDHDFGRYYEVVASFDESSQSSKLAFWFEENVPEFWDDEAKRISSELCDVGLD